MDWDNYRKNLQLKLRRIRNEPAITNEEQLNKAAKILTKALQETTKEVVKLSRPKLDTKRWWNNDLKKTKKELNRLRSKSYSYRTLTHHPSHRELKTKNREYREAIIQAKRTHWTNYLEEMTANEMWTANKYIKELAGNGGNPGIPTLKAKDTAGNNISVNNNKGKAKLFAKAFFPPPPPTENDYTDYNYPEPLTDPPQISAEILQKHIDKLSPTKHTALTTSQTLSSNNAQP